MSVQSSLICSSFPLLTLAPSKSGNDDALPLNDSSSFSFFPGEVTKGGISHQPHVLDLLHLCARGGSGWMEQFLLRKSGWPLAPRLPWGWWGHWHWRCDTEGHCHGGHRLVILVVFPHHDDFVIPHAYALIYMGQFSLTIPTLPASRTCCQEHMSLLKAVLGLGSCVCIRVGGQGGHWAHQLPEYFHCAGV